MFTNTLSVKIKYRDSYESQSKMFHVQLFLE